jgi:hypothetical protein
LRQGIPRKAVKPLIEHCNRVGDRKGCSGAKVMKNYLNLMKRYAGYFFDGAWPQKPLQHSGGFWLDDDESTFLFGRRSYREEGERFTVILLKRNMSLEGFDGDRFDHEFDFYGRIMCGGCVVRDAVYDREYLRKLAESNAETAEKHRLDPQDTFWARCYAYSVSADSVRNEEMKRVELEFMELEGGAEGKTCEVWNKTLCPYGAKSKELVVFGSRVKDLLELVEYYDRHWNGARGSTPPRGHGQWYHVGEPGFLDVTSREDILKAIEDGRLQRIADERDRYEEATRQT